MINIAELLKDVPKGTKLYSPLFGEVKFKYTDDSKFGILVEDSEECCRSFDKYGRYFTTYNNAECLLFPSKDCRTWEGWKLPSKPKFKVGDTIKWIEHDVQEQTITDIRKGSYITVDKYGIRCALKFAKQDEWELVPKPHYDISNFKPFDKVLVRQNDSSTWGVSFFGRCSGGMFMCCNNIWFEQCIPFNEDTKHLLGTTDMPSEEYINW